MADKSFVKEFRGAEMRLREEFLDVLEALRHAIGRQALHEHAAVSLSL
jgi:hypothetical protein